MLVSFYEPTCPGDNANKGSSKQLQHVTTFTPHLHRNKQHKPSLLNAWCSVLNMLKAGSGSASYPHASKSIKMKKDPRAERTNVSQRSTFNLRRWGLPPVYQTPGRRPNSAPYEGIRFLFVLCCDHVGPTYNSRPFNFNAAVMSLLWSVVHVWRRGWWGGPETLLILSSYWFSTMD